jgi:hypothetical protein
MAFVIGCAREPREQGRVERIPAFGNNSEFKGQPTLAGVACSSDNQT